ncbi:MAG: isopentenyl-diphosphate Delta-isomerase [Coriobacteriales bacterium]|jgi:isopentenyl-diphosphate delta-isomerase
MTDAFSNDTARNDELILVDGADRAIGTATKERVHREGLLHRAFSVVLEKGSGSERRFLIARRSYGKYHSPGLWANSCCSHPRAGEELLDAARRRLREELDCGVSGLRELGAFVYRAEVGNELVENEIDHVLVGTIEGQPTPNPEEIAEVRWLSAEELSSELSERPDRFAAWAPRVFGYIL